MNKYDDPKRTVQLLDQLEAVGLTDEILKSIHHLQGETIHSHRDHCFKLKTLFSAQTNMDVQKRLLFIFDSYDKYIKAPGNLAALKALARAAIVILPIKSK